MKRVLLALLLLFSITTIAQQGTNYKALIDDGGGTIVVNQSIIIQFRILQGLAQTIVYEETHTPTTDANGLVVVNIGEGRPDSGVFAALDWESDAYFLNTQIDTGGGLKNMGTTAYQNSMLLTGLGPAKVGDIRVGGVVFWVNPKDNRRGLVCSFRNSGPIAEWGCKNTNLPHVPNVWLQGNDPSGRGAEIGDGLSNTASILFDCPSSPAALAARSLGPEWFLPSINELNEMYVNKAILELVPGFSRFYREYWSSTERFNYSAWLQEFDGGYQYGIDKNWTIYYVRAVRAF